MGRNYGWLLGGVMLVVTGVVLGIVLTANYDLAPRSVAQDEVREKVRVFPGVITPAASSPFVTVADEVLPAVVSVDTKRTVRRSVDPFRDMLRDFFGDRLPRDDYGREEYREYEVPGSASGFIFDNRGYIMTNNHVVEGADEIEVTLSDDREFRAVIVGQDPSSDVAVIKIEGDDLPAVRLGESESIRVGDWAIAVGNPLELEGTVTVGVVSAIGRANLNIRGNTPIYQDFIQTDASINFGNSGGPLVNIRGEVIGMNTAINPGATGIGFAIPIDLAREVAEALIAEGKVVRGYLGVVPQEITQDLAEARGLDDVRGIMIASVEDGTPADDAGLVPGDVIREFAGSEITGVPQFRRVVAGVGPGEKVDILIVRDGRERTLTAELGERPDTFASAGEEESAEPSTWYGIHVVDVDDPGLREFDIQATRGVVVVSIDAGSAASDSELLVGDVIVKIGDEEIEDLRDYRRVMKELEGRDRAIALMVKRGEYTYFVAVKPDK